MKREFSAGGIFFNLTNEGAKESLKGLLLPTYRF